MNNSQESKVIGSPEILLSEKLSPAVAAGPAEAASGQREAWPGSESVDPPQGFAGLKVLPLPRSGWGSWRG